MNCRCLFCSSSVTTSCSLSWRRCCAPASSSLNHWFSWHRRRTCEWNENKSSGQEKWRSYLSSGSGRDSPERATSASLPPVNPNVLTMPTSPVWKTENTQLNLCAQRPTNDILRLVWEILKHLKCRKWVFVWIMQWVPAPHSAPALSSPGIDGWCYISPVSHRRAPTSAGSPLAPAGSPGGCSFLLSAPPALQSPAAYCIEFPLPKTWHPLWGTSVQNDLTWEHKRSPKYINSK